jgi:AcrR family transcriptional regulator
MTAAEQLFAEREFVAGASLRAITTSAGVNLAALNYHFHSKEELLHAVLVTEIRSNQPRAPRTPPRL